MAKNNLTVEAIEDAMTRLKSIDYIYPDKRYTTSYSPYTAQNQLYQYINGVCDKKNDEDKGVEEWVWVTGYKGTDKDMKCRDYQYEMGKQHDMPEGSEINICYSGFHFCDKPKDVFRYYDVERGNRFFEVKALVRRWNKNGTYTIEHSHDKMAAKSIQFVRELTTEEIFEHLHHELTTDWTLEQKNAARMTSIGEYYNIMRAEELVKLGYSEAFATWAVNRGGYEMARVMGNTPNVSMDVKVMTICMNIHY